MDLQVTVVYFLVILSKCSCNYEQVKLINDFILKDRTPTAVTALLDWNYGSLVYFAKELVKKNIQHQFIPTGFPLYPDSKQENQLFVVEMKRHDFEDVILKANKSRLFDAPYRWLLLDVNETSLNTVLSYNVLADSRVYTAERIRNGSFQINAIYKRGQNNTEAVTNNISLWSVDNGFTYWNPLIPSRNRSNLMGKRLVMPYVLTDLDSQNHLWDLRNKHIDVVSKISIALTYHLTDMINASRSLRLHREWGNSTSGLVADFRKGLADLTGTVLFFKEDRLEFVEYIVPLNTEPFFIFREPALTLVKNIYSLTFDVRVWLAILVTFFIALFVFYAVLYWEWNKQARTGKLWSDTKSSKPDVSDVLLSLIRMICQQGFETVPRGFAGRISFIFVIANLMALYTAFSGNIVALLQSTSDSIQTVEDLLNSRIKLGVESVPYNFYYFPRIQEPVRKEIYEKKVAPKGQVPNFMNVSVGIERMRTEFFAFHGERISAYTLILKTFYEHEKCGLRTISFLPFTNPWLGFRKNSTYREILKVGFRKLSERGIENRITSQYFAEKPKCSSKSGNFMSVGIVDCYFAFLMYGIGIGMSLFLLILENIVKIYRSRFH